MIMAHTRQRRRTRTERRHRAEDAGDELQKCQVGHRIVWLVKVERGAGSLRAKDERLKQKSRGTYRTVSGGGGGEYQRAAQTR